MTRRPVYIQLEALEFALTTHDENELPGRDGRVRGMAKPAI
jgi:hypothetical protein